MHRFLSITVLLHLSGVLVLGCGPVAESTSSGGARRADPSRPTPRRAADGEPCKTTADCQGELRCRKQWCRHKSCDWSLRCLRRLSSRLARTAVGLRLAHWLAGLTRNPTRSACTRTPARIAALLHDKPYLWKRVCGAPPVGGVTMNKVRTSPFRLDNKRIRAGGVHRNAPAALREKYAKLPDTCEATVAVTLTRSFQGWLIARLHEQHSCDAAQYKRRLKNPTLPRKCKTRPYPLTQRRYVHHLAAGTKLKYKFYFFTPPEVCKKPNLGTRHYKTGCFCMGIDTSKITLEWQEDPFLYRDKVNPGPRHAPRRRKGKGLDGLFH